MLRLRCQVHLNVTRRRFIQSPSMFFLTCSFLNFVYWLEVESNGFTAPSQLVTDHVTVNEMDASGETTCVEHAESCELEVSTYGGDAIHLTHFSKVNVKYAFKLLSFDSSTITARKCMHSSSRCGSSDQEYVIGRLT